ncbi:MAG: mechanosensitive ion channel family protein, partial [Halobacteriota archaeon]
MPAGAGATSSVLVVDTARDLIDDLPDLLLAVVVLLFGWWVSRFVVRLVGRSVARRFNRPSVTRTVLRMIRISIIAVAVAIAAWILGLTDTQLLLSVGVISAIVAILLAPLVSNFISGVFVLADRPYEIGDLIELVDSGTLGFVEDITLRYTKVFTLQNTFMVVPNATIRERDIVNYSAEDERTRESIDIVVTYEGDLEAARGAFERATAGVEGVIAGGPPIRIGSARYQA